MGRVKEEKRRRMKNQLPEEVRKCKKVAKQVFTNDYLRLRRVEK